MKSKKFRFHIDTWLPVLIFVLILVIFSVATGGALLTKTNLLNIFNQSVPTILAGMGMLFVAAMGGTDITTGVVVALAGCFGLMGAEASGNSDGGMLLNVGSGGTELMVRSSVERWCLPVVFGARVLLLGIFIFKRKRR